MSSDPQLVDDTTPAVQYKAGWIWDQLVDEVDHTRHGAAISGLQASLGFSGTGIEVVGTLGSSDTNGQPRTTYAIDGTVVGTYNAPVTPSGQTHYNVTFFSKRDLSPGDHEIVITNLDGTSPNHYWLDYFLIYKSPPQGNGSPPNKPPSSSSTSTTTTTHSFSATLTQSPPQNPSPSSTVTTTSSSSSSSSASASSHNISSSSSASSSTVSSGTSTSSTGFESTIDPGPLQVSTTVSVSVSSVTDTGTPLATVEANASRQQGHTNVAPIAGGVAGGVLLLVLLAFVFFWRRRQRRAREDIEPFGSASSQDQDRFSPPPSRRVGHAAKSPEMYFNQSAFASLRPPTGAVHGSLYPTSYPAENAFVHAEYSRTHQRATDTSPDIPDRHRPSPGAEDLATTKAQDSTIYESSSTSSITRLVPSRRQPEPDSPLSGSTSPVTPGSATSLLLHSEVARTPWYSPPQAQSRAQSLLRAFSSRNGRGSSGAGSVVQDVDSGLRTYNEAALPPPYTPD